jgi:hypothetical protein
MGGYSKPGIVYAIVSGLAFSGLEGKHEISEVVSGIRKANNRTNQKLMGLAKNVKQILVEMGFA